MVMFGAFRERYFFVNRWNKGDVTASLVS